jgi:hypothetical protein
LTTSIPAKVRCADSNSLSPVQMDIPVVLLNDIVQILTASASDSTETPSIYCSDCFIISSTLIDVCFD